MIVWFSKGLSMAIAGFVLTANAHVVMAQAYDPDACDAARQEIAYLTGEGDFVQEAGLHNGVDVLAEYKQLADLFCDPALPSTSNPAAGQPNPARSDPPATDASPEATPVAAPTAAPADDDNSLTRRDACVLVTEGEVGIAMRQDVTANEDDPAGLPGAQGCEFNGAGSAYTNVIYIQANSAFFYQSFHDTAQANGVQAVSGLGDRAFTYAGANGPGVVVVKGDKLFALEFSGIGDGSTQQRSLLALAQQALNRVH